MVMVDLINPNDFRIRTGIYPKVINIGNTNSRIVVINDFFLYPDKVREYALNCKYFKDPEIPMNPGYINYFGFNEILDTGDEGARFPNVKEGGIIGPILPESTGPLKSLAFLKKWEHSIRCLPTSMTFTFCLFAV